MNALARQLRQVTIGLLQQSSNSTKVAALVAGATKSFHTGDCLHRKWNKHNTGPQKWLTNNKVVHEPLKEAEERNAYVYHMRTNIKYSPDKMWYIACLVRGLSVDEAVKQLSFVLKKGATHVKDVILEAQEMAVKRHNVEFKSNMWISESFVGKGRVFKGLRRHGRGRVGRVEYKHCHYFVRLEEGKPPKDYYKPTLQPSEQLEKWVEQMRMRKVINSL